MAEAPESGGRGRRGRVRADDILSRSAGPKLPRAKQSNNQALQETGIEGSPVREQRQDPSSTDGNTEFVVSGGNYQVAAIGPQTHIKGDDYAGATIHHHHHYPGEAPNKDPLSKANIRQTENRQASDPTGAEMKQSPPDGYVKICSDIFMNYKTPLQKGSNVFQGYQEYVTGDRLPLAIKRISPYENKHLREVGHLVKLAFHPNVVRIIRSEKCQGIVPELYIAMELCSSQNLQDYLKENREKNIPFDFDQTMTYTKQLVSGVKHIHRNKVTHRDLKPENILLSLDGEQIKVSDFGISKEIRDGNTTKQTSLGEGTDGYRAPETFKTEDISQSADIFSLGLVIYPMWSNGKHAFGGDVHMRNPNIINNKGRDLSGLLISGTKENQLRNLIDWMLQPDPQQRPTIEQVAEHTFFKSGPSTAAEDPNYRSNLKQQPVKKSSLKPSANEKTLSESFQSALLLPTTSKKADSKEGIVIFDNESEHLQLFNPADNTLKQMQSYNDDMWEFCYSAVTRHDYIYVLMEDKPVFRLKYSDETATWERMPDMIDDHGLRPPAAVMSGSIYVAGAGSETCTNAVEKFDPSSNKWSSLKRKKMVTTHNALVVAQDFIYSIGGESKGGDDLKEVERFDPASSTWTFVAPMKEARDAPAAVEFNGKIFVLGGYHDGRLSSVEIYDPSTNVWSMMKNNMLKPRSLFRAFVVNGDIYAVGGDRERKSIERYSSEKDAWEEVQIQTTSKIYIYESTKIEI